MLSNRACIITLYPLRCLVLGLMKQIYGRACRGAMLVLLKPGDPTKAKRGRGRRIARTLTIEDGTLFILLSLLLLYTSIFPSSAASFLCSLHICQAFIKQLEEGVSFPWSSCQLFPISPAPWKSLQTPLSLGPGLSLGLGLGYMPCVRGYGSLWRSSLALRSIGLDSVFTSTDSHLAAPKGTIWDRFTCKACFISSVYNKDRKCEGEKERKTKRRGRK